jgi:hypothetical protein
MQVKPVTESVRGTKPVLVAETLERLNKSLRRKGE